MQSVPPSNLPAPVLAALRDALGEDGLSTAPLDRFCTARDLWPRDLLRSRDGLPPTWPDAVCWPQDDVQVAHVLSVATRFGVPVIPFGSASGVCGGAATTRPGTLILDLKRMARIEELDPVSLQVRVQAGMNGERLERELAERGFTLGHFPSSIYCSTVGGWVAARSAGQLSTRYGKIEDMLVALRGVLPDGSPFETLPAPRSAFGPDLKGVLLGSEGCFGVITAATFKIWPQPEARRFRAFLAPDVRAGTEAIRRTLRRGARPAAVRLYDELDTLIIGSKGSKRSGSPLKRLAGKVKAAFPGLARAVQDAVLASPTILKGIEGMLKGCLLIYTFEGDPRITAAEESVAAEEALLVGMKDLGEEPARAWWGHRYSVSFKLSPLISDGFFIDTFEVACPWTDLIPLYEGVRDGLGDEVAVMAHFSHAYPEGCSIYFSMAGKGKDEAATRDLYDRTWKRALEIARRHGATQSHHHGVGVLKQGGMAAEHGPLLRALAGLKAAVDPAWISNPGKLGLGDTPPGKGGGS